MNVVGYKVYEHKGSMRMLSKFYMNVVGYKEGGTNSRMAGAGRFYMNVVGYKAVNQTFIQQMRDRFI